MTMAEREIEKWVTINGARVPIYKDGSMGGFMSDSSVKVGDKKVGITKKRVNQKDVTDERIMEEIAGKDSYAMQPEYRELEDTVTGLFKQMQDIKKEHDTLKKNGGSQEDIDKLREQLDELDLRHKSMAKQLKNRDIEHSSDQRIAYLRNAKLGDITHDVKDEYEGFKRDKTGISDYDRMLKQGEAELVDMSPRTYLQEVAHNIFPKVAPEATLETTLRGTSADNVKKYMTMMENGTKFDTPYLNYTNSGQEGRHRAIAAYLLGIERIPVVIIKKR